MIPEIKVGLLAAPEIRLTLNGTYAIDRLNDNVTGCITATNSGDRISISGADLDCAVIRPIMPNSTITVHSVTIGIDFHWQRHEDQSFKGTMMLLPVDGNIQVINIIDIESYLISVVSSEMNARAYTEFIKAHAIMSRSWLMAQLSPDATLSSHRCIVTDHEITRWYDREAHTLFHVCADDHCQRYQGCTKAAGTHVGQAVKATSGMVLWYDEKLCDARFSKCCGGVTERFSTCWQPVDYDYLTPVTDTYPADILPDLSTEDGARKWIMTRPEAFCSHPDPETLATVLNDYDLETTDFYRWEVRYSATELAEIIRERSGRDFGSIISLAPLHRGSSGRIDRLMIQGTLHTAIIGKELEIRRTLSRSHLYSSAFTVDTCGSGRDGIPSVWILHGAGWGHGVGLCQIGAAAMAAKGYDYHSILAHYFPGATIKKLY